MSKVLETHDAMSSMFAATRMASASKVLETRDAMSSMFAATRIGCAADDFRRKVAGPFDTVGALMRMQDSLRSVVTPTLSATDMISGATAGLRSQLKVSDMSSAVTALHGTRPWDRVGSLSRGLESVASATTMAQQFEKVCSSHFLMRPGVTDAPFAKAAALWGAQDFMRKALPAFEGLEHLEPGRRFAVLMPAESPLAGFITSVSPVRRRPTLVPLLGETCADTEAASPQPHDVLVVGNIRCGICKGQLMRSKKGELQVQRRKLHVDIDVFPICTTCITESGGDPDWWHERMQEFSRRDALRVVRGEGGGDGVPRGPLRLVLDEEGPSDE